MSKFNGYIGLTDTGSYSSHEVSESDVAKRPNVVYIVLDDVGFAQFGCYGSSINTPNINKIAERGLRYNNFHTTAICSATRASLLTGANHHTVGVSTVVDSLDESYPNRLGYLDPNYATTAEVLKEYGYTNFAVGKWHLTPFKETLDAGPFTNWLLQKGFDRYYGFLEGMTDQYNPNLVKDNERIKQPKSAAEGYHLSEDLADQAIKLVSRQHITYPDKPFFLYLAFGAAHAPHQAPREYIDKYKGRFDAGWDVVREQWFENQKKLVIIPEDAKLTERNEHVQPWDSLSADEKKVYARFMEVFAGFLEHTDAQIGRVVDYLEKIGELDNTVIVLLSDNGASAEGGKNGGINHEKFPNLIQEVDNIQTALDHFDEIGTSEFSYPHYPIGWANAGNTPFPWYKSWVHSGGVKDPLIISYPDRIKSAGEIRSQYINVTDIAPTVLDILGVRKPSHIKGVPQNDYHGISFTYTFDNADAENRKHTQYFEMLGNRGIWHDGWKAVVNHGAKRDNYKDDVWELYHTETDYSESENVADKYPEKLQELINLWYIEAGKYGVLPLPSMVYPWLAKSEEEYYQIPTDKFLLEAQHFEYKDVDQPVDVWIKTMFGSRTNKITFSFEHKSGNEGILYSAGHRFSGYVVYVKENKLHYVYNADKANYYRASSESDIPEGNVTIQVQFAVSGKSKADVKLFINGKQEGSTVVEKFGFNYETRASLKDGFGTAVADDYTLPFEYPSELKKVEFDAAPFLADKNQVLEEFFAID